MSDPADKPALDYGHGCQGWGNQYLSVDVLTHVSVQPTAPSMPALPAPQSSAAQPAKPSRRGRPKASVEKLAAVRRAKQRVTARVSKAVDFYMDKMRRDMVSVPWLYVYATGSLGAASALYAIEGESEFAWNDKGDPWVFEKPEFWLRRTGLSHDGWVQARQVLRERGLIEERSRFDPQRREIVIGIQWMPEAFCDACSAVRADLRADLRAAIEAGRDIGNGL